MKLSTTNNKMRGCILHLFILSCCSITVTLYREDAQYDAGDVTSSSLTMATVLAPGTH